MIDLRSDTVTKPSPEMRQAMAMAPVGDDVYGDDPTVKALEEAVAALLGKEAAVYMPTGSMTNQVAIRCHTEPGDRVLMVLGGTGVGIALAMTSTQGRRLWHFIQGSRVEIRKVVWPTRQETTQTAIAVFIFTFILALFFWALDSGLLWLTRKLVG